MSDQTEQIEVLLFGWRQYIAEHPAGDDFSRDSGFISALTVCADQLQEVLERVRDE